ncbi:MAG: 30S ribosomal protein S6--L-glutamate ligase [Phycisphaeraceae bacterium JB051]
MKIAILTRNPRGYSVRRFKQAAKERGHTAQSLDPLKFALHVESDHPAMSYKGKAVGTYHAVIPRVGASIGLYGTAVVRQFEQMGVYTLNPSHAISTARDKLRSLQIFSRHTIGMPPSAFVHDKADVLPAIKKVGGAPVIIKLLEGSQGIGVILADQERTAAAIIETLQSTKQHVLVQKFVSESKGKDIRAFVVGGKVVAAMRRRAEGQEFRSNVHRGGSTEAVELDERYAATAVRAAHILGLRVAGVDMLEGEDGPQVMEVNASPGLEGIEKATGVDIAGKMIELIEERVQYPPVDIEQRLTVKAGYGVVELVVSQKSKLANKTIETSGLRERGVLVLDVERGGNLHPAPDAAFKMLLGDKLLCFGKLLTLKELMPTRKVTRKKKKVQSSAG